jgi:hypothetical protein
MSMQQWWNDEWKEKHEKLYENLLQYHKKTNMKSLQTKLMTPQEEVST